MAQDAAQLSGPMYQAFRALTREMLAALARHSRPGCYAEVVGRIEIQDGRPFLHHVTETKKTSHREQS
jgi:hypothetical protein